jgi:predicted transcriptional regulator
MLTLDEIKEKLAVPEVKLKDVAQGAGVSPAYVHELAAGKKKNPTYRVMKRLSDYLELRKNGK